MDTDQGRHTCRLQSQAKQIVLHPRVKLLLASPLYFSLKVQCPKKSWYVLSAQWALGGQRRLS